MRLENGFGSIHNIDGKGVKGKRRKPFRARISLPLDENGKRKYHTVGYFKTQKEAYEALQEYHRNPNDIVERKITVYDIYQKLQETTLANLSDNRRKMIGVYFGKIKAVHDMNIRDVKLAHIEMEVTGKSYAVQREIINVFKKIFEWAIKNEVAEKNYAEFIKAGDLKTAKTRKQNSGKLSSEEVNHLLKLARDETEFADAVKVYLYTGMRKEELFGMETKNVFIDKGYMIGGSKTEKGERRTIPIHAEIMPIIKKWHKGNKSEFLVNVEYYNGDNVYKFIKSVFPHHKIHNLRHTFVSRMEKLGVSRSILTAIVGHEDNNVTERYIHIDLEDLITAMNKFYY